MDARLNFFTDPTAGKVLGHIMSAGRVIKASTLPAATRELVALRVSQINGCAVCVDMHTKIDVSRSARLRWEAYVGPWFPEPLLDDPSRTRTSARWRSITGTGESGQVSSVRMDLSLRWKRHPQAPGVA
jgi:AhpD family alkylhydroperoxidase